MKERTKETLRDGFGCLVNNAAAVRGAKNGPLWLTIVMFVLSLFLPVLPIFITQANVKGSSFLNSYSYGLERYVTQVALNLQDEKYEFAFSEDHMLSVTKDGAEVKFDEFGTTKPFATYENKVTGQYEFMVYLSDATLSADKTATYTTIKSTVYANGSTTVSADKENVYAPSYMILFKDSVYVAINSGTKAVTASAGGDFKTIKAEGGYLAKLLTVKDKEGNVIAPAMVNDDYVNGVYANFKTFLNKSYETLRLRNMFATSGIYLGIFFGLCVVMGFLMWILTRGKNNPNNYYSIWLCMKIQARIALAPAIITFIVGFIFPQYGAMAFILTIGLRVMWMSMKELRPIQA